MDRSTSSSFFAASNARLLRASSCSCLTSPSLNAKRSRMGTPACLTFKLPRYTRRRALSLSDVLGRLSSSETSVLTYSHFLVLMFVTEPYGRDSLNRDRRLRVPHRNASTHSVDRTLFDYHHCPDCPSRLRRPLDLERRVAPPPRPTTARGRRARPRAVAAASWSSICPSSCVFVILLWSPLGRRASPAFAPAASWRTCAFFYGRRP